MTFQFGVTGFRSFVWRGMLALAVFGALLVASPSSATTITVNVTGAAQSGKCNLTDAVQAAVTNAAVHSCPAGSSSSTDTIQLANAVYQNYGKVIHVPSTGGKLVIQGQVTESSATTIRAKNYGYPSPNPLVSSSVCPHAAAIFSGSSNLTLKDLDLQSSVDGTTGVCQYAGSLTLNNVVVGDAAATYAFGASGVVSNPNVASSNQDSHRTLTVTDTYFWSNFGDGGGGLMTHGYVDITMTRGGFEYNTSYGGGGMYWSGPYNNTANVKLTGVEFAFNEALDSGVGGGLTLYLEEPNSKVTISDCNFVRNYAGTQAGAIYLGTAPGTNQVVIADGTNIYLNTAGWDSQQNSLNSDWPVNQAVYCKTSSSIEDVTGDEWGSPPMHGDGSCAYP